MEIKEFKKYTNNLHGYSAEEVEEFEFMSNAELEAYQDELERDTGNLSDWDHIRAFITLKALLARFRKGLGITFLSMYCRIKSCFYKEV